MSERDAMKVRLEFLRYLVACVTQHDESCPAYIIRRPVVDDCDCEAAAEISGADLIEVVFNSIALLERTIAAENK